jgi:hypothetical protein
MASIPPGKDGGVSTRESVSSCANEEKASDNANSNMTDVLRLMALLFYGSLKLTMPHKFFLLNRFSFLRRASGGKQGDNCQASEFHLYTFSVGSSVVSTGVTAVLS